MSQFEIDEGIVLNQVGKIIAGQDVGQYIKVVFDPKSTGGYYIFQSTSRTFDSPESYDGWVEDIESLNLYFQQSKWKIQWLPDLKVM